MKIFEKVKTNEVKRAFVISDFISEKKDRRKHLNLISVDLFREKLQKAKKYVLKLKESELDKIIGKEWKKRLVAYNSSDWYLAEVDMGETGVWSGAGSLPLSWTNGSLADTAKKVKYALDKNPKILKKRSRYSIPNILKTNVHLLQKEKYLLPIAFKGGTGTKGRKRLKRQMNVDLDDGCMRAIALAVNGSKVLKVYIGLPKK